MKRGRRLSDGTRSPSRAGTVRADGSSASRRSFRAPCSRSRRRSAVAGTRIPQRSGPRRVFPVQQPVERLAVFERGVRALAVERDDRVRRVAENERVIFEGPGPAADRLEVAGGVLEELLLEIGEERNRVREAPLEEPPDILFRLERFEALLSGVRQKQRRREAAVGVRQRDQHVLAPRPDVERVLFHPERAAGIPAGIESSLYPWPSRGVVQVAAGLLQDRRADRRRASVRPDQDFVREVPRLLGFAGSGSGPFGPGSPRRRRPPRTGSWRGRSPPPRP